MTRRKNLKTYEKKKTGEKLHEGKGVIIMRRKMEETKGRKIITKKIIKRLPEKNGKKNDAIETKLSEKMQRKRMQQIRKKLHAGKNAKKKKKCGDDKIGEKIREEKL